MNESFFIILACKLLYCTFKSNIIDVILKYVSVENQLSGGQIGISPLARTHRRILQHSTVRSIIIWSWQDHLPSGLLQETKPDTI
jgi:hypothetical protein